ncbi:type IV pilus assembly protein PilM [Candidatus Oleimmundimicrobium sp.]|uniref:type IV pilus assembly protein PilM n=1 Tax=Candidatus Oleimmundimicrobium sp. TaxID=3060597 RepID=UPI002718C992|nr:type IV pilus assembly protein PilM [Candidatus Oleimmundimicrobium sp.]MDO8886434.1 type IV pilus assembly protein PilM [Candidatus Oleimmundimicrobium sp.]
MGFFKFKSSLKPIGLDIGTNTIRAVQLSGSQEAPILSNYGTIEIPRGAVSDGEIIEPEVVGNSLIELWKKMKISEKQVVTGVMNQKVVVRLVELPFMQKDELQGALKFQAQEFIPIPIDEAIMDFEVVGDYVNENEDHLVEVLLVAAQKDMIGNNLKALEIARLKPVAIDVSSFAIVRALSFSSSPDLMAEDKNDNVVAFIHVGAGITNISIVDGRVIRFNRVGVIAGNNFTQSIVDASGVSFDEAEELKINVGLAPQKGKKLAGIPKKYQEKAVDVQEILEGEATKFVSEVRRSFDYYLSQAPGKDIKKIIFTGSGAMLKNFDLFMSKNLNADVSLGHSLEKIKIAPGLPEKEIQKDELSMAICLGLALREFVK